MTPRLSRLIVLWIAVVIPFMETMEEVMARQAAREAAVVVGSTQETIISDTEEEDRDKRDSMPATSCADV